MARIADHHGMTLAVDWDVKRQIKQTKLHAVMIPVM